MFVFGVRIIKGFVFVGGSWRRRVYLVLLFVLGILCFVFIVYIYFMGS